MEKVKTGGERPHEEPAEELETDDSERIADLLQEPLPLGQAAIKKSVTYNGWEFNRPPAKPRES